MSKPITSIHDTEVSEVMSELASDNWPGVRMLEPDETVDVVVVTHGVDPQTGTLAIYRRDVKFRGQLSEAIHLAELS